MRLLKFLFLRNRSKISNYDLRSLGCKTEQKAEAKNQKKALSTPKKVEYIKSELKKSGYNVKVNQEWDSKTKKYVSDLFKKRCKTGVNVNSISEVYQSM